MRPDPSSAGSSPEPVPPGAVFDCNLFLQAAVSRTGPAFACLELVETGQVTLYLSREVVEEARDVLTRPALQRKFPPLTPERVRAFLGRLLAVAVLVPDVPPTYRFTRDPKDEPYINLALASGARYLVSRDKDLLDLGTGSEEFKARFPDRTVLDPVEFLKVIRGAGGT